MKRKLFLKVAAPIGAVVVFALIAVGGASVMAQEETDSAVGLSISPTSFNLTADPGDSISNSVKVVNPTDNPIDVEMVVRDWTALGEEGEVQVQDPDDEDRTYSIAKWTVVSPATFRLEPGDSQTVAYEINLPNDAEPGSKQGTISAVIAGSASETTGSAVSNDRSTLVLLTVSGDAEEELVVDTFSTEEFREYGPVDFEILLENTGNVHMRPKGIVSITDFAGNKVEDIEIPQNNIIPGAKRDYSVTWEEEKPIGRYTATLVASYGTNNQETLTDSITFIVFPWKTALIILAVVLAIIILLFLMRKRLKAAGAALAGSSGGESSQKKEEKPEEKSEE